LPAPSGDAFTPARVSSISQEADGTLQLSITAPLPLLTNDWTLESSSDLSHWASLTNIPGLQFSAGYSDKVDESNRFYRIGSAR
jgi:hypothetical protein